MKAVIQRVKRARVTIKGEIFSQIETGLLVFIGIETSDTLEDITWLAAKITHLRIFSDAQGLMNLSIDEIQGEFLVVSQFTLHASTKKGNRPSYIKAARPEMAIALYEKFVQQLKIESNRTVNTGVFAADMQVELINDGPVTILIDSKNRE